MMPIRARLTRALVPRVAPCGSASLVNMGLAFALLAGSAGVARAQTVDDAVMVTKGQLVVGNMYSHDTWEQYWEGGLKRVNGNIGTITTQTDVLFATYGLSDRLNVITAVPHVWTRASQGVLHGMQGLQDLTLAAKYTVVDRSPTPLGSLRAIAVASGGLPLTGYTPDFLPLSIGSASKRLSGRFTLDLQSAPGWYVNGSTSYTVRSGVTLDRPYYFTDGRIFFTDEVDMPNVFDYLASAGYMKDGLMAAFTFSQQRTLGGGDIRRQDMPFVSNRMNFARVGGMVMAPIPKVTGVAFQVAYAYTIDGRNVGQATTVTTGLMYTLPFQR